MKVKELVRLAVVLALLGGAVAIVAQEFRHSRLVDEFNAQADTLELMTQRVDSLVEVAVQAAGELDQMRERVRQDSIQSAQLRAQLAVEIREARDEGERITLRLRARLDSANAVLLDSITMAHQAERTAWEEDRVELETRVASVMTLERATAEALAETRTALEACQCALEQAGVTVGAARDAIESRGILGRAWDAITSTPGLVIIGGVLTAWGLRELTDSDHPGEY